PRHLASTVNAHPLIEDLSNVFLIADNGLPVSMGTGETLAEVIGQAAIGLVDFGEAGGQILVLSDVGSLDYFDRREHELDNLAFLRNLARYAHDR
ncbi:MAG: hypothetical protein RI637_12045, partial [Acidimicrobiia bacterium]|nr:hypothetical protein [Acidimicrobiia bacterium]